MKKEYANEFGAIESAHMRSKARGVVGALPPLPDDIQSQITEVFHPKIILVKLRMELSMRFIVALLIASLFIDKADSELSFISRHNLYPCASYSPGVHSKKYSHPCPFTSIPRASSLNRGGGAKPNRKTHFGFRDNQARTDDFHHAKLPLSEIGLATNSEGTGVTSLFYFYSKVLMCFHAPLRPRKMDKFLFLGTRTRFVTTKELGVRIMVKIR
ncbi:hypothetical protein M9H77_09059 [Catharanthus roseus]|uniref:Uncharacterized protein n=1 Tax=Catharanthus roseus TaxID=4058 RepID=A0ACC0BZI7_CATRO|nr:hypothetical protein M9H77_09059 [Catharanthus roseus]